MTIKNPQATTSLVSTVGGGELVVNIARLFHWSISTGWGIAIAGGISGAVLFVWDKGLLSILNRILHGNTPSEAQPVLTKKK